MPTFATPQPISLAVEIAVGDATVIASDRTDTTVDVRPTDPSSAADIRAAQQTRIDFAAGKLVVQAAKQRTFGVFGKPGSVDVVIELPSGSRVDGNAAMAAFHCSGRLGQCQFKTATGDIRCDHTGGVNVHTATGAVDIGRVDGNADVTSGSGRIRLGEINGSCVIKNSNGDTWIGQVSADLRVNAANGAVVVDRADADVAAHTANGDVRVGDLARGTASLKTAMGEIEVGIRAGTAALLDVSTQFGAVRNEMQRTDGPSAAEERLEVHARTSFGDVLVHRA